MGLNSSIEWTDHTINLWWGCEKVHTGCKNCYAEIFANRFTNNLWGAKSVRKRIPSAILNLIKIQKKAEKQNTRTKVFVGSMMDIFESSKPLVDAQGNLYKDIKDSVYIDTKDLRDSFFNLIQTRVFSRIDFLLLTKRPENILNAIPLEWHDNPPQNVIIGISASNQDTFDALMPKLTQWKGKKFVSLEPQVGPISLGIFKPDWVIQGGESGPKKRLFILGWARSMRNECQLHGIPYFFKQIDKVEQIPDDLQIRQFINLK